jgi:hypothetical protein
MSIDVPALVNVLVSGLIGFLSGVASSWVAYRYQRKRDDIAWERELVMLHQQFTHEIALREREYAQRLKDLEEKLSREESDEIRRQLLRGVTEQALPSDLVTGDRLTLYERIPELLVFPFPLAPIVGMLVLFLVLMVVAFLLFTG